MALVALAMVGVIAMAALSVDIGTLYEASAEAQRTADAGALAAARTISMQGLTGDPTNASASWQQICGGSGSPASLAATTVVQQSTVGGTAPSCTAVTYSVPGTAVNTACPATSAMDCSTLNLAFGVNPQVTVLVQQPNVQTYFSRIWGRSGNTVSATATAEVFNPSNSATYAGSTVPVQPRCVKPWVVPNLDPLHPLGCGGSTTTLCSSFVDPAAGTITTPGISVEGGGVISERFWLMPNCQVPGTGSPCTLRSTPPQANYPGLGNDTDPTAAPTPNVEYLPGQTLFASVAVPADGSAACSAVAGATNNYAPAIAGCDQLTKYQCGVQSSSLLTPNQVDLSENPGLADTTNGVQCLIHQTTNSTTFLSGQDTLLPTGGGSVGSQPPNYPFQIQAGAGNPLSGGVANGAIITSSNNIVSLPIYDSSAGTTFGAGTTPVTIIGFLQVFVNVVDSNGNAYVTVLNVSGCGNTVPNGTQPVYGTSPVPVRLITPTPPSS
jgi:Flp pilus assembly protein TadG